MANPWHFLSDVRPADGAVCWIVRWPYDSPFQGTYRAATFGFSVTWVVAGLMSNWMILKWRLV
jgi:hypothetical protein